MITSYHGIDLHSNNFFECKIKRDKKGKIKRTTGKYEMDELKKRFIPTLNKNDYICVEASTGAFAFAKTIEPYVKEVIVIHPADFKALYMTGKKTDKIDTRKLANRLKYYVENKEEDESDFPRVYIPEEKIIKLRSLFSMYDFLRRQIAATKNKIRAILRNNLILYPYTDINSKIIDFLNKVELDGIYKKQIEILLRGLEPLEEELAEIKEMIQRLGVENYYDNITKLISIVGISIFTACAIIADVGDFKRFKGAKQLCSYLRSAPKIDASNNTVHIGKINKRGRKRTFTLILQGLHHIIKNNPYYKLFYETKTKGKSKGKVRSALVRKTIVAIFYMMKNDEQWRYSKAENYKIKLKQLEKYKGGLKKAA